MEHIISRENPLTLNIHLNRPGSLNSLTSKIVSQIRSCIGNNNKELIFTGEGRAFCAGGDVVLLSQGKASPSEFFRNEFNLFFEIYSMRQQKTAVLDGITMGGGVGLSMACSNRILTDKTL